jgi:hypothetical protein
MARDARFWLHRGSTLGAVALGCVFASLSACSGEADFADDRRSLPQTEERPAATSNWIRLDGKVVSATSSMFFLDHGDETIFVETGDWNIGRGGLNLAPGDVVEVTGRATDELFSSSTLQASFIHVPRLHTFYVGSLSSSDQATAIMTLSVNSPDTDTVYAGVVTGAAGGILTVGRGHAKVAVDTSRLHEEASGRSITAGDRIYVWGDLHFLDKGRSTLTADGVIELIQAAPPGTQADISASRIEKEV